MIPFSGQHPFSLTSSRRPAVRFVAVCLFLLAIAPVQAVGEGDAILGVWTLPDGQTKIEIHPCSESKKYCGRIAWLQEPNSADGQPRVDERNPNPKRRSVSVMGMEVLWGLTFAEGKWTDGQYYHLAEGKTYKCVIEQIEPGKLQVHSFVGIAALGKSQIWTR